MSPTPEGLYRKGPLTSRYLKKSFSFYREASDHVVIPPDLLAEIIRHVVISNRKGTKFKAQEATIWNRNSITSATQREFSQ